MGASLVDMTMTERGKPLYTCDECGGRNGLCSRDCPEQMRWEAVRPKACPCCGTPIGAGRLSTFMDGCPGGDVVLKETDADEAWLCDHPGEQERVRPMSAALQLWTFLYSGVPHTHVVAYRSVDHTGWATF